MLYLRHRKMKKQVWNPFEAWKMITIVKRKDGSTFEREFKSFEYIGQETEEGEVVSIYYIHELSEKQKKWEALCEEWR